MAAHDRGRGFVRTIAPQMEAVGEQAVLDSEAIEGDKTDASEPGQPAPPMPAEAEADPRIGTLIHGRYRLVRVLGRGGMGTVYLAEHASIPKTFAVKLLNPRYASRNEFAARFLLEAQAVSLIDHPNVVGVVDFGTSEDGSTFLVMEHLRGESLELLCRRDAPLAWARVRHLMVQVCRALQAAHDVGVIHRDIKPDNLLRLTGADDPDSIKVLDFGLAKIQTGDGLRLTRTGMVLGTPRYMAPEQARGSAIDHRVDIYAAGILIYELLCARTPFQGATFMEMRGQHLLSKPQPPSHWAESAGITAEMDAIALRALAKDPDHRFASMREMAAAIEAVGKGRGPVAILERDTKPFGLSTSSMIAERGRLTMGRRRTGEVPAPAMEWAGKPVPSSSSTSSIEPGPASKRRGALPFVALGGVALGVALVFVAASANLGIGERTPSPTITVLEPLEPAAPIAIAIAPLEPVADFVGLTLATNVPVRVLEARDQAIVGDTRKSTTVALPRSSARSSLLLRAEGYLDLPFEVTPDRDLELSFTLELAPPSLVLPSVAPELDRDHEIDRGGAPQPAREPEPSQTEPSQPPPRANRVTPEIRDPWTTPR